MFLTSWKFVWHLFDQPRSKKSAMGWLCTGLQWAEAFVVWERSPQPQEARGLKGKPPDAGDTEARG